MTQVRKSTEALREIQDIPKEKRDSVGDIWYYCDIHNTWWHCYCAKCHPKLDLYNKCVALAIAIAIVSGIVWLFMMGG